MRYRLMMIIGWMALLTACSKDRPGSLEGNWLFPVAKGAVSLNTLNELKNRTYQISVPALSIGQPVNTPVSSPGLQLDHVGPFALEIVPWLHRLDVDSMEVAGSLRNIFPIPIGTGTRITVRSSPDTAGSANVLGSTEVRTDVLPGGQLDFSFRLINRTIGDSVYFFLDHFNSPPYSNVVFSGAPTTLSITLKLITAGYIELYSNRTFSSTDTVAFTAGADDQLGGSTGGTVSDTGVSGTLNLFLDNGFPARITGQLYFMNEARDQILDSLFTTPFTVDGATTDAAGNPVRIVSTVNRLSVSRQRVAHIKAAKYVIVRFGLNTSGYATPWVAANRSARLAVQLTGDLSISFTF